MILSPVSPITTSPNYIDNQLSSRHEDGVDRAASPRPISHWLRRPGASYRSDTESSGRRDVPSFHLERTPYRSSTPTPSNLGSPRSTSAFDDTYDRHRLFPYQPHPSEWSLQSPRASHTSSRLDRPFTPDVPSEVFLHANPSRRRWSSVSLSPPAYSQLYYEKFESGPRSQSRSARTAAALNTSRLVLQLVVFLATVTTLGLLSHSLSAYEPPKPTTPPSKAQDYLSAPTPSPSAALTPSVVLLVIAIGTLLTSALLVLILSGKSPRYISLGAKAQIGISLLSICAWMGGLITFEVLGTRNRLRGAACNAGEGGEGVCVEQAAAFWFGLAACAGWMLALAVYLGELGVRMKVEGERARDGRRAVRERGGQCVACGRA